MHKCETLSALPVVSPADNHEPCGRRKMLGYFGHETSDVVVCVQTGGGGQCVSPGRLSGLTFYSKADCSVTGCL